MQYSCVIDLCIQYAENTANSVKVEDELLKELLEKKMI